MQKRILSWVAVVLALLVFGKPEAIAQEARSFVQLQVLVRPTDTVTVTERGGAQTRGRIVAVTDSSLQLAVTGAVREFAEVDVLEIRQRRPDSLANGAKYGVLAGGTFGALGAALVLRDCVGCAFAVAGLYAALGAGIGVGIDALIVRERTIFTINRTSSTRINVSPLVSSRDRGLLVSISF
jgi:hypothetical protein